MREIYIPSERRQKPLKMSDPLYGNSGWAGENNVQNLKPRDLVPIVLTSMIAAGCGGTRIQPTIDASPTSTKPVVQIVTSEPVTMVPSTITPDPAVEIELMQNADLVDPQGRLGRMKSLTPPNKDAWVDLVQKGEISQVALDSFANVFGADAYGSSGAVYRTSDYTYIFGAGHVFEHIASLSSDLNVGRGAKLPGYGVANFAQGEYGLSWVNQTLPDGTIMDFGVAVFANSVADAKLSSMYDMSKVLTMDNLYSGQTSLTQVSYSGICTAGYNTIPIIGAYPNPNDPSVPGRNLLLDNVVIDTKCSGGPIYVRIDGVDYWIGPLVDSWGSDDPTANTLLADNVTVMETQLLGPGGLEKYMQEAVNDLDSKR